MESRNAIVTLCIGAKAEECAAISHPTMKAYAARIGADFHVMSERRWPDRHVNLEKLQMHDIVLKYKRTLYLDSDVIISGTAPDIFEVAPPGQLAFMNERDYFPDYVEFYRQNVLTMKWHSKLPPDWVWPNTYFNAGIFVTEPAFAWILKDKPSWQPNGDQIYQNTLIHENNLPVFRLPAAFNYMPFHVGGDIAKACEEAYFIHAGHPDKEKCIQMMREIAETLGKRKG